MIHLDPSQWAALGAFAIKLFIDAAITMPVPKENCHWWIAWGFDLAQTLAANPSKVGQRRRAPAME